ncbi:MAG: hypothetical protein GYA55_09150 [SAR324 cluster bacterium]|uniref:Uncharacterized protein n=1 Tax=SAR324 cluster bacterium TaxID=2024889 RepID=A0A7X9FS96_9DELT|nr:hypothetical protein [SAR324 cluster bacterium]
MDNGEEIPCLNESWTFAGAKATEWIAGLAGMMIFTEVAGANAARSMPLLLTVWVLTTFGLAILRRQFPDEERGVRNYFLDALGFAPPGIPKPASIQPYWSGAPMKFLKDDTWFKKLDLDRIFEEDVNKSRREKEE